MERAVFVWSGGKDSALALYRVLQGKQYQVTCLLTTVNEKLGLVSMHGVRTILLEQQAAALRIPLTLVPIPENASMEDYEKRMRQAFLGCQASGITTALFGDIFLADLRAYRENQLNKIGLKTVFPLWQENAAALVQQFIALQFKAILVCVSNARLGEPFVGQQIDADFLQKLPADVDPAGENGEYHSFVYDGPLFQRPVLFMEGEKILRDYATKSADNSTAAAYDSRFWFLDLLPV